MIVFSVSMGSETHFRFLSLSIYVWNAKPLKVDSVLFNSLNNRSDDSDNAVGSES